MGKLRPIVVALAVFGAILGLLVAGRWFLRRQMAEAFFASAKNFDETKQPWIECSVPYPGEIPKIVFMQKSIHPFLAEYKYKVRLGEGDTAVERWLPINVGGSTQINAYWYPAEKSRGPWIRLQDHWGEYLLELGEKKTYLILRHRDRTFAGEITSESPGWGMTNSRDGGKEVISASVGPNPAAEISDSPVGKGRGRYFGRIDGQRDPLCFIPAAQSQEKKIEMVKDP